MDLLNTLPKQIADIYTDYYNSITNGIEPENYKVPWEISGWVRDFRSAYRKYIKTSKYI